jgi:hypothetical protein
MSSYSDQSLEFTSLPDLAWLSGSWIGSQGGQHIEEHWSRSAVNELIGMFRMVQADKPVFYEFMTLGLVDKKLTLKIKHFNPGLIGWEDKDLAVTYEVVHYKNGEVVFYKRQSEEPNWMVYRLVESKLVVFFVDVTGQVDSSQFEFERNVSP